MTNSKFVGIRYRKSRCKLYGIQIYARMNVGATYRDVHSDEKSVSAFDRSWHDTSRKTKILTLSFTPFAGDSLVARGSSLQFTSRELETV